jgi:hypothetical protein
VEARPCMDAARAIYGLSPPDSRAFCLLVHIRHVVLYARVGCVHIGV